MVRLALVAVNVFPKASSPQTSKEKGDQSYPVSLPRSYRAKRPDFMDVAWMFRNDFSPVVHPVAGELVEAGELSRPAERSKLPNCLLLEDHRSRQLSLKHQYHALL